jgi:peptide deformylase
MAVFKLVDSDSHLLKEPLLKVSEDCDRKQLQDDLIETMKNFKGLGLSANQIGTMERVFAMYINFEKREAIACFNPKITYYGEQEVFMDEGCLSYPGLWLKVKRPYNIFVNYENVEGELIEEPMKDMEARIFQHEMDHMEGKDFTSHVSKLRMDMAKKRQQKQHKKIRRMVGQ